MGQRSSRSKATNRRQALVNLGAQTCGLSEFDALAIESLDLRVSAYSLNPMNRVFMKSRELKNRQKIASVTSFSN